MQARLPSLSLPLGLVAGLALGMGGAPVCLSGASRILFAMARDGYLPRTAVARASASPFALCRSALVACIGTALAFWALPHAELFGRLVSFGALSGFLLVNLSVIANYGVRGGSRRWLRHWLLPALGAQVIAYILSGIRPDPLQLGALWTLLGALVFAVMRATGGVRPASIPYP